MVHTLKGVSGNIGAMELYDFTVILDEKMKNHDKIDIESELKSLDERLTPIIISLKKALRTEDGDVLPAKGTMSGNLDTDTFKKLLLGLKAMLLDSDIDAAGRANELELVPGSAKFFTDIQLVKDYISDFNFDEAAEVVDHLIQSC